MKNRSRSQLAGRPLGHRSDTQPFQLVTGPPRLEQATITVPVPAPACVPNSPRHCPLEPNGEALPPVPRRTSVPVPPRKSDDREKLQQPLSSTPPLRDSGLASVPHLRLVRQLHASLLMDLGANLLGRAVHGQWWHLWSPTGLRPSVRGDGEEELARQLDGLLAATAPNTAPAPRRSSRASTQSDNRCYPV